MDGELDDNCLKDLWREAVAEQRKRDGKGGQGFSSDAELKTNIGMLDP